MKVLYLAHRVPYPPNKGDKIRSFHEIKHFSRQHELHVLAFYDRPEDAKYEEALHQYCQTVKLVPLKPQLSRLRAMQSMLIGKPWTVGYFRDPVMGKAIAGAICDTRFDLAFVYSSSMAPYIANLRNLPKILDFVDSDASKWRQYARIERPPWRWLYEYEARHLARFEVDMARQFDCSVFVSAREADHLRQNAVRDNVHFVQNGIDLDYFRPPASAQPPPNIVFVGAMDYFPNVDAVNFFAREVLPEVRSACDEARFVIVGSNPGPGVQRLSKLPGVEVTGTVADVRRYLAQARVAVVPIRIAQGIQNKILEALAAGLPVVTTPISASGLTHVEDLPVAIAQEPAEFVKHVLGFLNQPRLSPDRVERCRNRLRLSYDWSSNMAAFDGLFDQAVRGLRMPEPLPSPAAVQVIGASE